MKIGFVTKEFPPFFGGGIGTSICQISSGLADQGHEVHVFTIGRGSENSLSRQNNLYIHRMPFRPPDPFKTGLCFEWEKANETFYLARGFRDRLLSFVKETRLDIVEFPETEAPGWMLLMDSRWDIPTVVNCHSPTWLLRKQNGLSPQIGQSLELAQIALADGVCAPSDFLASKINSKLNSWKPIQVLPHPFYSNQVAKLFLPPKGKNILFVGRLERLKGVITLVKAANMVLDKIPDANFIFAGGDTLTAPGAGSMKDFLAGILSPEHSKSITFLGNVQKEKLYQLYKSAAFCVFPSLFDNFPNVCLESMAAGRTALYSSDTGMSEIFGDSGIAFPKEDRDILTKTIIDLLNSPETFSSLGEKAFHRVRNNFGVKAMTEKRELFYRDVIKSKSSKHLLENKIKNIPPSNFPDLVSDLGESLRRMFTKSITDTSGMGAKIANKIIDMVKPESGLVRVALYGAGAHTRKLSDHFKFLRKNNIEIVIIIDDNPKSHGSFIAGVPVLPKQAVLDYDLDRVILSSDSAQSILWKKSISLRKAGLAVIRLYDQQIENNDNDNLYNSQFSKSETNSTYEGRT